MGMDVYGNKPTAPEGEYFRASVWSWHPIWSYCEQIAPQLTSKVKYGHSNDGDGLKAACARTLGAILSEEIASGKTAEFLKARQAKIDALPEEPCQFCNATGVRRDGVGQDAGQPEKVIGTDTRAEASHPRFGQRGWCNGCDGSGKNPAPESHYSFEIEHITEFAKFLNACGGFRIC